MATSFPAGLDDFTNPTPTSDRAVLSHAGQHANTNDAVEAIEAKVGVDGSAVVTSLDYRTTQLEAFTLNTLTGQIIVPASATSGTAIMAGITALPTNGGTIVLGAGTHTLDVAVRFSKNMNITGVADVATIVRFDPALGAGFAMADTTQRRINMSDMRIDSTVPGTGTAIDASKFVTSTLSGLRVGASTTAPNIGISFAAIGSYYNHVRDCVVTVSGTAPIGIQWINTSNSNSLTNTKVNVLGSTTGTAVKLGAATHTLYLEHLDVEFNDCIAVDIEATAHDVTMVGCYIEQNTINVRIGAGCESVRILGGYVSNGTTADIQDNGAVGLSVHNLWLNFNPYTWRDELNVTRSRVNGISVPPNTYQPDDLALKAWNYDVVASQAASTAVNGTLYLSRMDLRWAETIANLSFYVAGAGVTPVASQNYLGIYNSAGTLVASTAATVVDAVISATGYKTVALSAPYAAAAGRYWVGLLFNAATPPGPVRATGVPVGANVGLAASLLRFATNGTALTTLPASITPASNTATGAFTYWVGAS